MSVYESIMQGFTEAVAYQPGKTNAQKSCLNIKLIDTFNNDGIKRIRQITDLSQVIFAFSFGVSPRTFEAWKNRRNKSKGATTACLRSSVAIFVFNVG